MVILIRQGASVCAEPATSGPTAAITVRDDPERAASGRRPGGASRRTPGRLGLVVAARGDPGVIGGWPPWWIWSLNSPLPVTPPARPPHAFHGVRPATTQNRHPAGRKHSHADQRHHQDRPAPAEQQQARPGSWIGTAAQAAYVRVATGTSRGEPQIVRRFSSPTRWTCPALPAAGSGTLNPGRCG
jgi:hypothetical protein